MIILRFIFPVVIAFSLTASGQERLTLNEALELALSNNPQIQTARNNSLIAENQAAAGRADLLPRLSFSGGFNYLDTEVRGSSTVTNAGLAASYTIFDGFGTVYRYKLAGSYGRLGRLQALEQIENNILQVCHAYYRAASSFEALTIAKETLGISRERLRRTEKRAGFGRAGNVDVLSAKVDVNTDSVGVVRATLRWDESQRDMNLLLQREISAKFQVDTNVMYVDISELNHLLEIVKNKNTGFLIADERFRLAGYNAGVATSALFPKIDLSTSIGYSQTEANLRAGFDNMSQSIRAGLNISWMLFNGSRVKLASETAKISHNNQRLLKSYAEHNLERLIINAYESWKNSHLVLKLEEKNLAVARLNFKRNRDLYNLGQVTTTQFRESQLNLFRSRTRLQSAKYTAKLEEINIQKLSGSLVSSADLKK